MENQLQELIELQKAQNKLFKKYLWRFRFSLLTLLLVTTGTAIGLGILIYKLPRPTTANPMAPTAVPIVLPTSPLEFSPRYDLIAPAAAGAKVNATVDQSSSNPQRDPSGTPHDAEETDRKRFRKLRIAWSVAWGLLAALMCVLWVYGYWYWACIKYSYGTVPAAIGMAMTNGNATFSWMPTKTAADGWSVRTEPVPEAGWLADDPHFALNVHKGAVVLHLPCWSTVLIPTTLAAIPWLQWRFSLRTLLIATTLIAVVLGIIVWLSRAG